MFVFYRYYPYLCKSYPENNLFTLNKLIPKGWYRGAVKRPYIVFMQLGDLRLRLGSSFGNLQHQSCL